MAGLKTSTTFIIFDIHIQNFKEKCVIAYFMIANNVSKRDYQFLVVFLSNSSFASKGSALLVHLVYLNDFSRKQIKITFKISACNNRNSY